MLQTYFDGIHNDQESVDRLVGSKLHLFIRDQEPS